MATRGDVTGLDVLMYGGKPLIPMLSYTSSKRTGVVQSSAAGGMTRQRKKYYGNCYVADATFSLKTLSVQDYMAAFSRLNEGKKFICYLRAERPLIEPYVVQVLSEWPNSLVSKRISTMTVTLEIENSPCPDLDEFLSAFYRCLGDDMGEILRLSNEGVLSFP